MFIRESKRYPKSPKISKDIQPYPNISPRISEDIQWGKLPDTAKRFHGSLRMDLVLIWQPGINNGAFSVPPDSVWYVWVLLLFSTSAVTDTGSKSF